MRKIIIFSKLDYFLFSSEENCTIVLSELYKESLPSIIVRIARRISATTAGWIIKDYDKEGAFDVAIIPDIQITKHTVKALSKKKKKKKTIIYYQNKISKKDLDCIKIAKKTGIRVFTYNLHDAREFNLEYNPQFWNMKYLQNTSSEDRTTNVDVFFCGKDKGRYEELMKLKQELEDYGATTNFIIISNQEGVTRQTTYVPYDTYIGLMKNSRIVIDLVNKDNKGLTVRPLEALFMKKKLITNYKEIVEYDFYEDNKDNIFIIGETNMKLSEFLKTPFKDNRFDMTCYSETAWIKRFIDG